MITPLTPVYQTDLALAKDFLFRHISRLASSASLNWLEKALTQLAAVPTGSQQTGSHPLYMVFGMAARQMSKEPLPFSEAELQAADAIRRGFQPQSWNVIKATRVLLVLSTSHDDPAQFQKLLDTLFSAAEVHELEALYASLPLLPYPERFVARAAEGIRSNIRSVFDAVALDNPYPADYLDENAWNQLVLKSIFIDRPLDRIYGFDARRNAELARMLSDFAHERWAAGRTFPVGLWRAFGPFLNEQRLKDLEKAFAQSEPQQAAAAALACTESTFPAAQTLLATRPDLQQRIASNQLTWETLLRQP